MVRLHRLIALESSIGQSPARLRRRAVRIVVRKCARTRIHRLVLKLQKHRTMELRAALLHDHVHHAAQRSAMLCLNTRRLDLNLLNKVKGNVGVRVAANQIRGLLPFHQVRVLRVRTASDRVTIRITIAAVARRYAAAAIRRRVTHQRLIARRRGKLNHRLVRPATRYVVNHVLRHVRHRRRRRHVDRRRLRAHIHNRLFRSNRQRQVHRRQTAHFQYQTFLLQGREALRRHRDDVRPRRKIRETVVAFCIRRRRLATNQRRTLQGYIGMRNHRASCIFHRALQTSGSLLSVESRSSSADIIDSTDKQCQRKEGRAPPIKIHVKRAATLGP